MRNLSVGFISQDWTRLGELNHPNGCTWYRCVIPAGILNSSGNTAHVGLSAQNGNDKLAIFLSPPIYKAPTLVSNHDIIVLKLVMHSKVKELLEKQIAAGKRVVVDIDDWFDDLPESNRARILTDPDIYPENNRDIYFQIIEMAHALICSTEFLYTQYSKKYPTKPIFLIRNSIDIERWTAKSQSKRTPTVGWFGATPWRANDLEQLSGFFNNYLHSRNLKFHHAGHIQNAPTVASLMNIDQSLVSTEPMSPLLELPGLMRKIDVGIVPLNDVPFNHAKSYLKGLEYAAAGIPFVASWSPEYQLLADSGVGRIAKNQSDWEYHLDELIDQQMRKDEASINREIVSSEFSMQARANEWLHTFFSIMDIT